MFKKKLVILALSIIWLLSSGIRFGLCAEDDSGLSEVSESEEISFPGEEGARTKEVLEKLLTELEAERAQRIEPSSSRTSLAAETSAVISAQTPGKIYLDVKRMNILDVLKILSEETDFNIVVGKNVTGVVTMFLKDVEPFDALEIVILANGLAYEKKDDVITIMTDRDYELLYGERFQDKKELLTLRLRFAKAVAVSKALLQVKSKIGRIVVDEGTNTLILLDLPEKIKQMQEIAQGLDKEYVSKIFALNYARAEDIKSAVEDMVTEGIGSIKIDAQSNKVIIRDYPEKIAEIGYIIEAFDEKIPQVLIESEILEITLSDEFKMGIDWESWFEKNVNLKGMFSLNSSTAGKITLGEMTSVDESGEYRVVIEALKNMGATETLSTPRITVTNNQEAKILIGTRQPYVTQTIITGEGGAVTTSEEVTFVDIGVKLYVTPTISKDGFITMKIRPEISSMGTPLTTARGESIPVVSTTEAETTVTVKDGATIVIAGLMKDKTEKTVNKIPLLGDIPLLGFLFKKTQDTVTKTELVILLTPHIFAGDTTYPSVLAGKE